MPESLPPERWFANAWDDGANPWLIPRLLIDLATGAVVGSLAFKSEPRDRIVEIGYGMAPGCRGRGFATAGVQLMVNTAFASGAVDVVRAETRLDNKASQRVLQKSGFTHYSAGNDDEGPVRLWMISSENRTELTGSSCGP